MLFGTFLNPRVLKDTECGFYAGASGRITDMLIGRNVSTPATEEQEVSSLSSNNMA
jgi:hypothetical protein